MAILNRAVSNERPVAGQGVARPDMRAPAPARRVSVLGATGSVGCSTLELIAADPAAYDVVALTAHRNVEKLAGLAVAHRARVAVIADASLYGQLKARLAGSGIEAAAGEDALVEAASRPVDWVMAAIIGSAGLRPTLAAVRSKTCVALANKECLVSAGAVFMRAVADSGTTLLPVDSEHSAAFQVIDGLARDKIERIVLTASGGPFRTWSRETIAAATPDAALKHPNYAMGAKITIDSATLMNKGLELIEAFHLFSVRADQLGMVVHPQQIVHAMVEYADGSVLAQMGTPDMRTPIAYSLAWPRRMHAPTERLDLTRIASLTFEAADLERFPALGLAMAAMRRGGAACTLLNAANEIAVEAYLARQIPFYGISAVVEETLAAAERRGLTAAATDLEGVLDLDLEGRALARALLANHKLP
jgi:1-deoxy-D-xylulose-5-phosphate reductoisomerase